MILSLNGVSNVDELAIFEDDEVVLFLQLVELLDGGGAEVGH